PLYQRQIVFFAGLTMSRLHRDEAPEAGVNDLLAGEGHQLRRHFRVTTRQNSYESGATSACAAPAGNPHSPVVSWRSRQPATSGRRITREIGRCTYPPRRRRLNTTATFSAHSASRPPRSRTPAG